MSGGKVWVAPLIVMVADRRPQLFDNVGDGQAAAFLDAVRHGQGGGTQ